MAQSPQATAGGEAAPVVDAAAPASDPIEALADSWFDDERENEDAAPEAGANEDGLTPEDAADEDEPGEGPAIDPPVSWTAEEKAKFAELPREVQETLSRRETEREKFVQSKANEAAQARQTVEREAIAQVQAIAQQHAQAFQTLLPQVPQRPHPMLQVDDPIAYAEQLSAHEYALAQHHHVQQAIQGARAQANQAEQMIRQHEQQAYHSTLTEHFPEFLDPTSGPKLREQLGSTALELGYSAEVLPEATATDILAIKRATDWKVKADKYDALMAKRMETVREAKNLPPVARPGGSSTRSQAGAKAVEGAFQRAVASKGSARTEAFAEYLGKAGLL